MKESTLVQLASAAVIAASAALAWIVTSWFHPAWSILVMLGMAWALLRVHGWHLHILIGRERQERFDERYR